MDGREDPRGKPERVFRIRKENTDYGDSDYAGSSEIDDSSLFDIWNMYIDAESGQEYYYNTSSGRTSFKPPKKVQEELDKEMEEMLLLDTGADLPEELQVYAREIEADAREQRMQVFKKDEERKRKEAEAADKRDGSSDLTKKKSFRIEDDEEKRAENDRARARNAKVRQEEFIEWMTDHEDKLRFYDIQSRQMPTATRFHEVLYKDPKDVTDEELSMLYKFQSERDERWDVEILATIRLQVAWRRHKGGFHLHIKRQAQRYRDEAERIEREEKEARRLLQEKEERRERERREQRDKLKNLTSDERAARIQIARQRLLEAEDDDTIDVQALMREIVGEEEHTHLSQALSNDLGAGMPEQTLREKMKLALMMMESGMYKTCFLAWKNYTREAVYYRRAMHHDLSVRFHQWHIVTSTKKRLRTRMQKVTVTFYFTNLHWAFHLWYMRTRVNFTLKTVMWNGKPHRILEMRADLSARDSDGRLGLRGEKVLIPQVDYTEDIRAKADAKRLATLFSKNDSYHTTSRYDEFDRLKTMPTISDERGHHNRKHQHYHRHDSHHHDHTLRRRGKPQQGEGFYKTV